MTSPAEGRVLCVFVPGIKGSVLKCVKCHRQTWPPEFLGKNIETIRRFVSKRSTKLEQLMDSDESSCLVTHEQTAYCVIKELVILNGVYKRDVYGKFLKNLQKECDGVGLTRDGRHKVVTLYAFAYDWTLGVRHAAERLYYYLQEAINNYSAFALIGHSMGGLISRFMLEEIVYRERATNPTAQRIYDRAKLVYALGVPHYGTVRSLHYLIDPRGGDFTRYYRTVQSLYDMIPFSDLTSQIDGLSTGKETVHSDRTTMKRKRSDIFLKRSERDILVAGDDWRPSRDDRPDRCEHNPSYVRGSSTTPTPVHVRRLVDMLTVRFPELAPSANRILEGAAVHFSLNSDHRPVGCVYFCVNAVGVMSPSLIDKNDTMIRGCKRGDGLVCSVVEPRSTVDYKREHYVDEANKYTVHVKMLKRIDVFRVVCDVLANDIFGSNTTGKRNGIKYLWRKYVHDHAGVEIVSNYTFEQNGIWEISTNNLNSDCCVLTVRIGDITASSMENNSIVIGLLSDPRDDGRGVHSTDRNADRLVRISVNPARDWNRVTVILVGQYRLFNVRALSSNDGCCKFPRLRGKSTEMDD